MAGGGGGVGKEGAVVVVSEKADSFIRVRLVSFRPLRGLPRS
jgi:hypothetical protein